MRYMTMREQRINNQKTIKEENIKTLFSLISSDPGITRAQLGRVTTLSPTTVSTLVDELVQRGLVVETGPADTQSAGRKPISLKVNPRGRQLALFSLSRWGIRFWLYNLALEEVDTHFIEYSADHYGGFAEEADGTEPDAGEDYMSLIESILIKSPYCDPSRLLAICISFPGIRLAREKAFSWSAMRVSFSEADVLQLEKRLNVPVFLGNAALSRAYAEKKYLEGPNAQVQDLIYVTVRDGLGAGIIAGGVFLTGRDNSAGEIGHVSVDYKGKRCACGQRGCVEQFVTIDALTERVQKALNLKELPTVAEIGEQCLKGNPIACEIVDDVAAMLFTAIFSTVCVSGIKRVVIGGGIEQLGDYFLDQLRAFPRNNPRNKLARDIDISYARSGLYGDIRGIAQFYLDNVFTITMDPDDMNGQNGWEPITAQAVPGRALL
ncbi:MAG: ROK family transcriptional regulator [Eubacteriales bacterium]|nr:ROK family transcriptional regulator [Eubacteriales bacterium]